MRAIVVTLLMWSGAVIADEYRFLVPSEVSFEAHQYKLINDPYLAPIDHQLKYGGVFTTDFALIQYGKYSFNSTNRLSFEQSEVTGRVKSGGWRFTLNGSIQLYEHQHLEIGKYHHSYHIFEEEREEHFPTSDSYYIKFVIFRK
jgi:hypothetical protein